MEISSDVGGRRAEVDGAECAGFGAVIDGSAAVPAVAVAHGAVRAEIGQQSGCVGDVVYIKLPRQQSGKWKDGKLIS